MPRPSAVRKPRARARRQQSRHQRRIDEIGHHQRGGQRRLMFKRRLPDHAKGGGVDQQAGAAEQPGGFIPTGDMHAIAEFLLQCFRPLSASG